MGTQHSLRRHRGQPESPSGARGSSLNTLSAGGPAGRLLTLHAEPWASASWSGSQGETLGGAVGPVAEGREGTGVDEDRKGQGPRRAGSGGCDGPGAGLWLWSVPCP